MQASVLAPLLLLTAFVLAASPAHAAGEQDETVFLHDTPSLHIAPEAINGVVGETFRFTVVDQGQHPPHNLVVCGDGVKSDSTCSAVWGRTPNLGAGQSANITFTVPKSGTFEYFCDIPGHKAGGMRGTLNIQGGDDSGSSKPTSKGSPGIEVPVTFLVIGLALVARRTWRRQS